MQNAEIFDLSQKSIDDRLEILSSEGKKTLLYHFCRTPELFLKFLKDGKNVSINPNFRGYKEELLGIVPSVMPVGFAPVEQLEETPVTEQQQQALVTNFVTNTLQTPPALTQSIQAPPVAQPEVVAQPDATAPSSEVSQALAASPSRQAASVRVGSRTPLHSPTISRKRLAFLQLTPGRQKLVYNMLQLNPADPELSPVWVGYGRRAPRHRRFALPAPEQAPGHVQGQNPAQG